MLPALRRAWTVAPVTSVMITIAVLLHVAVLTHPQLVPDEAAESYRAWGAARDLGVFTPPGDDGVREQVPQLTGHFDLWQGEWWRVAVSGFHHADLLHLAMNCVVLWFLGSLLEPRLNRWVYLAFFLSATTVSMLPEFLLGNTVTGLSGTAYAQFAVVLVLRKRDPQVATACSEGIVQFGLVWLFACLLLTALDVAAIANYAHFSGFAYGWLSGQLLFGSLAWRRGLAFAFAAGHLLLWPAFYFVTHPVWNGRYHWYRALHTDSPEEQTAHFQNAVRRDPALRQPWLLLAEQFARRDRWHQAWQTVISGLSYNRSDEKSVQLARRIWRRFRTEPERKQALTILAQTFPDEAEQFQKRLGIYPDGEDDFLLQFAEQRRTSDAGDDAERFSLDQSVDLRLQPEAGKTPAARELHAPDVNPDDPHSAVEGRTT